MVLSLFLGKYSDWLEAYSILCEFDNITSVYIYYAESKRNNRKAVESLFKDKKGECEFYYKNMSCSKDRDEYFKTCVQNSSKGDIIAAPFVQLGKVYCKYISSLRSKGVISVNLSEELPNSFGLVGYRFGYKLKGNYTIGSLFKEIIKTPYAYIYSLTHKPDVCYFALEPEIKNPFVINSVKAHIPQLDKDKLKFLTEKIGTEKRTLLIGGYGYDVKKMASNLKLDKYIATSKFKGIIIDGDFIELDYFFCAEEVLLSGLIDRIVGYCSTAMCWAKAIGNIQIECYESSVLCKKEGLLYDYLCRNVLKKCGIELHSECKEMITLDIVQI